MAAIWSERILHGTAHDVLMAVTGLGDYFRQLGVIPASRQGVGAALRAGCDVIIWPGGEEDSMRSWRKRDQAVLAGRKGFVRQAIRSGVPIVPVASVGGSDTAFVLSEGRWLANGLDRFTGLKVKLRGTTLPIILGFPFGLTIETIPTHIPLPAKIRTELLDPIPSRTTRERVERTARGCSSGFGTIASRCASAVPNRSLVAALRGSRCAGLCERVSPGVWDQLRSRVFCARNSSSVRSPRRYRSARRPRSGDPRVSLAPIRGGRACCRDRGKNAECRRAEAQAPIARTVSPACASGTPLRSCSRSARMPSASRTAMPITGIDLAGRGERPPEHDEHQKTAPAVAKT